MGGLITLYTGMKHQDVFGQLGVFSPSLWAAPALFPLVSKVGRHYPMKIYLTVGQKEGSGTVHRTEEMFQTLSPSTNCIWVSAAASGMKRLSGNGSLRPVIGGF